MNIRYFYYSIVMTMLINAIINVPMILFKERFNGSIMAMILSIPISTIFALIFSKCLGKFPNQGLPEILRFTLPNWARIPITLYLGIMWYIGGLMVLAVFALICVRFINPDLSIIYSLLLFMVLAGWGALQSTKTVLYILEIIMILSVPFIGFIIVKAVTSHYMDWKEVLSMGSYVLKWPTWRSLSAATYLFIGYINMVIFNREFHEKLSFKFFWLIPLFGFLNFFTTFAVPIGFLGPQAIENYTFPWINTADSLKMEYGFIERVIFLFLILYISISLLFGIVCWHVSLELIKSSLKKRSGQGWNHWLPFGIIVFFIILPITMINKVDELFLMKFSEAWLSHRFFTEILLVAGLFILTKVTKGKKV